MYENFQSLKVPHFKAFEKAFQSLKIRLGSMTNGFKNVQQEKCYHFFRSEKRVTIKDDAIHEISAEQSSSNKEQVKVFRKELAEKGARLEAVMAEKSQMQNRIKVLEDRGFDGKNKNLETISRYSKFTIISTVRLAV